MSPSKSILTAMTIPYFVLGVSFRKVSIPLKILQVLLFLVQCTLSVTRMVRLFKLYSWNEDSMKWTSAVITLIWLTACFLTNAYFLVKAKRISTHIRESIEVIDFATARRLTRRCWISAIFVIVCYVASFTDVLIHFLLASTSTSPYTFRFIMDASYKNTTLSSYFIYLTVFEITYADVI